MLVRLKQATDLQTGTLIQLAAQRVGDPGFVITSLPEDKKKKRGFRITSPEGYATDFYLDEKTNQVKSSVKD